MELFTVLILTCCVVGFDCLSKSDQVDVQCTNRFEYRLELQKHFGNCSEVIQLNSMCGKNITVAYEIHPPYLYKKDGRFIGILPAMLRYALQSCCFGCNQIRYIGPYEGMDKFYKQATLVLPIQTSIRTEQYFGHDYIHMFEIKAVNFIGPEVHFEPDKNIQIIFSAVFSTWPLFATAIFMAVTAGVTIWVLDNGDNEEEFPNSFPRGPFEGFWWAVVSMTTVGYGDRSPKGVSARLFAMVWILIGITIFSMYSATLTTSLTSAVIASGEIPLYRKTFAVLNTTTIGSITTMKQSASSKGFASIAEISEAIQSKKVDGMALDENIANYYSEHMSKNPPLQLYQRLLVSGSSYGMVSYEKNFTRMFKSFYSSNDDQRDIMAMMGMGDHMFDNIFVKAVSSPSAFFGSDEMLSVTLLSLTIFTVMLIFLGLFLRKRKARKRKMEEESDLVMVTTDSYKATKNGDAYPKGQHLLNSNINGNHNSDINYVSGL